MNVEARCDRILPKDVTPESPVICDSITLPGLPKPPPPRNLRTDGGCTPVVPLYLQPSVPCDEWYKAYKHRKAGYYSHITVLVLCCYSQRSGVRRCLKEWDSMRNLAMISLAFVIPSQLDSAPFLSTCVPLSVIIDNTMNATIGRNPFASSFVRSREFGVDLGALVSGRKKVGIEPPILECVSTLRAVTRFAVKDLPAPPAPSAAPARTPIPTPPSLYSGSMPSNYAIIERISIFTLIDIFPRSLVISPQSPLPIFPASSLNRLSPRSPFRAPSVVLSSSATAYTTSSRLSQTRGIDRAPSMRASGVRRGSVLEMEMEAAEGGGEGWGTRNTLGGGVCGCSGDGGGGGGFGVVFCAQMRWVQAWATPQTDLLGLALRNRMSYVRLIPLHLLLVPRPSRINAIRAASVSPSPASILRTGRAYRLESDFQTSGQSRCFVVVWPALRRDEQDMPYQTLDRTCRFGGGATSMRSFHLSSQSTAVASIRFESGDDAPTAQLLWLDVSAQTDKWEVRSNRGRAGLGDHRVTTGKRKDGVVRPGEVVELLDGIGTCSFPICHARRILAAFIKSSAHSISCSTRTRDVLGPRTINGRDPHESTRRGSRRGGVGGGGGRLSGGGRINRIAFVCVVPADVADTGCDAWVHRLCEMCGIADGWGSSSWSACAGLESMHSMSAADAALFRLPSCVPRRCCGFDGGAVDESTVCSQTAAKWRYSSDFRPIPLRSSLSLKTENNCSLSWPTVSL
ncbi:hypothetical protein R3P38DRAFT_3450829 [Favolaschia claudopus]|uniref:Uncharacterized protein n=1 Tax=Favolaschia claudopus TaxID=2862362 RepID=A0AAV9ZL17_9AGAR